ncbi:AAA family ATPase [Gammaproteobacteria bacterium]|nr:AAA family ATPase [Gammaproteobacteria bacterium]
MNNIASYPWLSLKFKDLNLSTLPHSTLIEGSRGLGKSLLVEEIAKTLLCLESDIHSCNSCHSCNLFNESTHPDLFINDDDSKILVDEIRGMIDFSVLSSSVSKCKIIILNNCENMNIASQNAILKTLEEPNPNTFILMTSSKRKSLNATIYSRCNKIILKDLDQSELSDWIKLQGISDFNFYDYPAYLAPLDILKHIDEGVDSEYKNFSNAMLRFCTNDLSVNDTVKYFLDMDMPVIDKVNLLIDFFKTLLKSDLGNTPYSGKFVALNSVHLSRDLLSNSLDELNDLRSLIYKVSSINESHAFRYFISKLSLAVKQ